MPEIKECPFCGGATIQAFEGSTHLWGYLACNDCGGNKGDCRKADISLPANHEINIVAFAVDWNTRTAGFKGTLQTSVCDEDVQRFADKVGLRCSLVPPSPGPSFSELSRFFQLVAAHVSGIESSNGELG